MSRSIIFLLGIVLSLNVYAAEKKGSSDIRDACLSLLGDLENQLNVLIDNRLTVTLEERPFKELLVDPTFIENNPWLVMSAPQRLYHLVKEQGISEMPDPETGAGKIKTYKLFSGELDLVNNDMIVDQYRAIEQNMSVLEAAVRGDTAGLYPSLILGPPGTGKTAFLTIFAKALTQVTLRNPGMKYYTYEWKNLGEIPELKELFEKLDISLTNPFPCEIHDSPIVLLPEELQKAIIAKATPKVQSLIGYKPIPKTKQCPKCDHITHAIMAHHKRTTGKDIDIAQGLEILEKHVTLKRLLLGEKGTAPLIPAQSKDVDTPGLLMGRNGIAAGLPPNHPFAYFLTGKLILGNGSLLILDEAGKNPPQLIAKLLNTIQSREVAEGGAPTVSIDAFIMMASNTIEVKNILEADKQSPFLSRATKVNMNWPINPQSVAKTLAFEMPSLTITKLGTTDGEPAVAPARGKLNQVFPTTKFGNKLQTSDGRYALYLGEGEDRIHISPHALMFLSSIVALSRQTFNVSPARLQKEKLDFPVVAAPFFRNPLTRLKAFFGEIDVEQTHAAEFFRLSKILGDGTFGFDHRDATKVMGEAITEARKSLNGHCVTPTLIHRLLTRMLEKPEESTAQSRLEILNLAQHLARQFFYPKMINDVVQAFSQQEESGHEIYETIVQTMKALNNDAGATEYYDKRINGTAPINRAQLDEIMSLYAQQHGRGINWAQMAQWHLSFELVREEQQTTEGSKPQRLFSEYNPELMSVITAYLMKNVSRAYETKIQRIISIGLKKTQGTAEEITLATEFINRLKNNNGYCNHCLQQVLHMMVQNEELARRNAEQQKTP